VHYAALFIARASNASRDNATIGQCRAVKKRGEKEGNDKARKRKRLARAAVCVGRSVGRRRHASG